ncbi:MAG: endonuclease/exonuclease/phosphatase family protein [Clostridia bacterium]|nr:endonuclease/exonuclease/phosphatase family protein [Clostridia bacterium]
MKKRVCSIILSCLLFITMPLYFGTGALTAYAASDGEAVYKVAHYNIMGTFNADRNDVIDDIKGFSPDLISLNEVNQYAYEDLVSSFAQKGYSCYGNSDWSPDSAEFKDIKAAWYNLALYKSDKFELLDSGMFTLSDNPDENHSFISYMDEYTRTQREGRPRTCSWIYLKSKETGGKFIFATVHAQHAKSDEYDYNNIGLTVLGEQLSELKEKYNCAVICAGDVNSTNPDEVVEFGFGAINPGLPTFKSGSSIDNVFVTEGITVENFDVGTSSKSDHMPVFATLNVPVTKDLTDAQVLMIVIIIASAIVASAVVVISVIFINKKKEKNMKAADDRVAEMRAKLAEYERVKEEQEKD